MFSRIFNCKYLFLLDRLYKKNRLYQQNQVLSYIFNGGVPDTDFSRQYAPDLILGYKDTNKSEYINKVKNTSICIATTGLHDSIGWRLGEYVSASRAIISQPLKYDLPGNFCVNKNYLEFDTINELIENIYNGV